MTTNVEQLGTREEIVQSLLADLQGISIANSYTFDVDKVVGYSEPFDELSYRQLRIESGVACPEVSILSDLHRKTVNLTVSGQVFVQGWAASMENLRTETEALLLAVCQAIRLNPTRLLNGTAKAYNSTISNTGTDYEPPRGHLRVDLKVVYYDTK